jgi:hypothetical protein
MVVGHRAMRELWQSRTEQRWMGAAVSNVLRVFRHHQSPLRGDPVQAMGHCLRQWLRYQRSATYDRLCDEFEVGARSLVRGSEQWWRVNSMSTCFAQLQWWREERLQQRVHAMHAMQHWSIVTLQVQVMQWRGLAVACHHRAFCDEVVRTYLGTCAVRHWGQWLHREKRKVVLVTFFATWWATKATMRYLLTWKAYRQAMRRLTQQGRVARCRRCWSQLQACMTVAGRAERSCARGIEGHSHRELRWSWWFWTYLRRLGGKVGVGQAVGRRRSQRERLWQWRRYVEALYVETLLTQRGSTQWGRRGVQQQWFQWVAAHWVARRQRQGWYQGGALWAERATRSYWAGWCAEAHFLRTIRSEVRRRYEQRQQQWAREA